MYTVLIVYVWFHTVFKEINYLRIHVYCLSMLMAHSDLCALSVVNMGQIKLTMDKFLMVIYLSLGKYNVLLFPNPCIKE